MNSLHNYSFSDVLTVFRERHLPVAATLAGYAALIEAYGLQVPLPRILSGIGERHRFIERDGWRIYSPRHAPDATLEGHITFALKREGLNLAILKSLFSVTGPDAIADLVKNKPTSAYARRVWFLYEWLTGKRLDLPDADSGPYAAVVNPDQQYAVAAENSTRHRIKNNLPGTPAFCPLVFRTEQLENFIEGDLQARAHEAFALVPRELLKRTVSTLLFQEAEASFAIEGEQPLQSRIHRWAHAIAQAGRRPIDVNELLRLQNLVIGDARFIRLGLRTEGGFVGRHNLATQMPIPDHISARPDDLEQLIEGIVAFEKGAAQYLDPILAASVFAFAFVYIHPFEDGNGRLHRYLIHHLLAQRGFNPPGLALPVSAAILDRIEDYRTALEDYSQRLLPAVKWEATERGNVQVLNDTGDFYRFFDATVQTEFMYGCVQRTIEVDLPQEAEFLRGFHAFRKRVNQIVDMPERVSDLLFRFLHQNAGTLSRRRRTREFAELTDDEVSRIESIYQEEFGVEHP